MRKGRAPTTVGASGGVHAGGAGVRLVARRADQLFHALVLRPADVRQHLVLRPEGGAGVVEDGQPEAVRDPPTERPGQRDRFLHGGLAERHEGNDVHRAEAGVLAGVMLHVDPLEGERDGGLHGVADGPESPRRT